MNQSFTKEMICNNAIFEVGGKRISSLDEGSSNSILCLDVYPQALNELLEEHPWSFATRDVSLTELTLSTDLPIMNDGLSVAYGLPDDFVSVYMLSNPAQYRIEQLRSPQVTDPILAMLSDIPSMSAMRYVFLNDDPTNYTAKFCRALSLNIALKLCFKISEAAALAGALQAKYDKALLSAISVDSNNSMPDEAIANTWFVARLAGSGVVTGLPNGNVGFFPDPYNPDF